jgi:hypothetical protein
MIDRRQLVTGLAAVAAASALPSFPACAAPPVPTGLTFQLGEYAYGWSEAISETAFGSVWQVQPWGGCAYTIRHCATGLTFASSYTQTELLFLPADPPLSVNPVLLDTIGHAADLTRTLASFRSRYHAGAFFYGLPLGSPYPWMKTTADAPSLPRLVRASAA